MLNRKQFMKLNDSWKIILEDELQKQYFKKLKNFIFKEIQSGKTIFPPSNLIFNAFNLCPLNKIKVIILGQDPYHNDGQAHGLCFSVPNGIKKPPSLMNIFKEIKNDVGIENQNSNLENWATQGVFLLNSILTVEAHQPLSHSRIGWEIFTDYIIKTISKEKSNLVFLLWGSFAQKKNELIDQTKHLILTAAHPSPLSAHNGFFNCHHFSKTNSYLIQHGYNEINWLI